MPPATLHFQLDHLATPIGDLYLVTDADGHLRATFWTDRESELRAFLARHYAPGSPRTGHSPRGGYSPASIELTPTRDPHGLTSRVAAYFAGDLHAIDGIPVRTAGTEFQKKVWRALRDIPCGTTISYSELARRIHAPAAVRAVGAANGANPIGVIVPCHRVIGAGGTLTGYGGGIERKRWLLEHEGALASQLDPAPRLF